MRKRVLRLNANVAEATGRHIKTRVQYQMFPGLVWFAQLILQTCRLSTKENAEEAQVAVELHSAMIQVDMTSFQQLFSRSMQSYHLLHHLKMHVSQLEGADDSNPN